MHLLNFDKRSMHVSKHICNRYRTLNKIRPRVINYSSYRDFFNETFGVFLINNLSNKAFLNNDDALDKLCKTTMDTLNSFATIRKNMFGVIKYLS